jgi:hypothetical protein
MMVQTEINMDTGHVSDSMMMMTVDVEIDRLILEAILASWL